LQTRQMCGHRQIYKHQFSNVKKVQIKIKFFPTGTT
jgi:hypothetical protein